TKIAQLRRGRHLLEPDVALLVSEPGSGLEHRLLRRLRAFVKDFVGETLGFMSQTLPGDASPALRGLTYQLSQNLGSLTTQEVSPQVAHLAPGEQEWLERAGVHFGKLFVFWRSSL